MKNQAEEIAGLNRKILAIIGNDIVLSKECSPWRYAPELVSINIVKEIQELSIEFAVWAASGKNVFIEYKPSDVRIELFNEFIIHKYGK